jgi:hypothetical protein
MERVRDAAVSPVKEAVPVLSDEDLAVVEVVVLDRLRDPDRVELRAHRCHHRHRVAQAPELIEGNAVGPPNEQGLVVAKHTFKVVGELPEAFIRDAEREEPFDTRSEKQLEFGIPGQDREPVPDLFGSGEELAEPAAGITHQQPPTIHVGRDELNEHLGYDLYELTHERGLETLDRCVRLEPGDPFRGGYPEDGRPGVDVRLLDRLDQRAGHVFANPRVSILEPVGIAPVHEPNPIPLMTPVALEHLEHLERRRGLTRGAREALIRASLGTFVVPALPTFPNGLQRLSLRTPSAEELAPYPGC